MTTASEYRKRARQTADVTLPSGAAFTLTRPPLTAWVASGRLPQALVAKMQTTGGDKGQAAKVFSQLSAEETQAFMIFLRQAVIYACVAPKLVADDVAASEDELQVSELDPADFEFLCKWVMTGSPDIPIATKGGEVKVEGLAKFPRKRPGRATNAGADGAEVREAAE